MEKYKNKKQLVDEKLDRVLRKQKTILNLYENSAKTKQNVMSTLKENGLLDVLNNYFLPSNYDFTNIDDIGPTSVHRLQEYKLPFKNEDINIMLNMPKIQISSQKTCSSLGKIYHSVFLVGKYKDKKMLFLLAVEYHPIKNTAPMDFQIKLDAYVGGKTWFSLLRLDSIGNPHLNYFKNNVPCKNLQDIRKVRTPHLHIASYESQLYTDTTHYSNAEEIDFVNYNKINFEDGTLFYKLMQFFIKKCNAKVNVAPIKNKYIDLKCNNVFEPLIIKDDEVINWIL